MGSPIYSLQVVFEGLLAFRQCLVLLVRIKIAHGVVGVSHALRTSGECSRALTGARISTPLRITPSVGSFDVRCARSRFQDWGVIATSPRVRKRRNRSRASLLLALCSAEQDATVDYEDIGHSDSARDWTSKLIIGYKEGLLG